MATSNYDQKNAVDGWGTSTQLTYGPPTPYRFRITSAEFNVDMRRKGSESILHLVLRGIPLDVDDLTPIEDWATHEIVLKCGPGWETPDNGATAAHKNRTVFDGRTAAGEFVDRIVSNRDLKPLFDKLRERGKSTQAAVYVGLDVVIGESKHKARIDGEEMEYARPVPIEYHGEFDLEGESKKSEKAAGELIEQLEKLANESDDHATFQNEAMALGATDGKLLDDIMDDSEEGFYERTRKMQAENESEGEK